MSKKILLIVLALAVTFGSNFSFVFAWQGDQGTTNELTDKTRAKLQHIQKIYISKTLSGKYPEEDASKEFDFSLVINDVVRYDFTLKLGETASYSIQEGSTYSVTEGDYSESGYTPTQRTYKGKAGDDDIYITYVNVYQPDVEEDDDEDENHNNHNKHNKEDPDDPDDPDNPDDPDDPNDQDNPDEPGDVDDPDDPNNPVVDGGQDSSNGSGSTAKSGSSGNGSSNAKTNVKTVVPKTGDNSAIFFWILILLVCIVAGALLIKKGKFLEKKDDDEDESDNEGRKG